MDSNQNTSAEQYMSMDHKSLQKLCSDRKIKYCYQMGKKKMVEMLTLNDEDPSYVSDPKTKEKNAIYQSRYRSKRNTRKYWLDRFIDEGLIDKKNLQKLSD